MVTSNPTQLPGDNLKKALIHLSELLELKPDQPKQNLIQEVELRFNLSPRESEFLHKHFSK